MQKFIVSRDDTIYEAWPDLAMGADGRLVCIFSECTAHTNRELARLTIRISDDRGRSWSDKIYLSERGKAQRVFQLRPYIPVSPMADTRSSATFSKTNRM